MLKKLDTQKIAEILDNSTLLRQYCSGGEYEPDGLLSSLAQATEDLRNYIIDTYSELSEIIITPSIKNLSNTKEQRLILGMQFKCSGIEDRYNYSIGDVDYDKMIECIAQIVYLMVYGSKAINVLNSAINSIQSECGSSVGIRYRWGISDKFCRISDWDYDWLYIKLNKTATIQLVAKMESGELDELIRSDNWDTEIKRFIEGFNSKRFHCSIGAALDSENVEEALQKSMLSSDDAIAIIRRNNAKSGLQSLKTVEVIKELGRFIAICEWAVDYGKKTIEISLEGSKVFDVDKGRFIGDHDIVDRVLDRVSLGADIIKIIFNTTE